MAEPLGVFASAIAVLGLATKITKYVDDLVTQLGDAKLSVLSLQTSLTTFESSMKLLSQWMKKEYQRSDDERADHDFLHSLDVSMAGHKRYLIVLGVELKEINYKLGGKEMSFWKKMKVVWAEKRIRRYCDELRFQNEALIFLLNARQLVQQQDAMLNAKHRRLKKMFIKILQRFARITRTKQG